MPLPNRVAPTGDFLAVAARGAMMGNRGVLHGADGRLGAARWRHRRWVCCVTAFRGRWRAPMPPGRYTALFFLDEATALAAGHRPCAECRNADYRRWLSLWRQAVGPVSGADDMDRALHAARVDGRAQRRWTASLGDLPDGTFVLQGGVACRVQGDALSPYAPEGYGPPQPRRAGTVTVLTPAPSVAVLAAGYAPTS